MMGLWDGSGISWTIHKQSAPHCRQTTTPNTSLLNFYRSNALPDAQPSVKALKANDMTEEEYQIVTAIWYW